MAQTDPQSPQKRSPPDQEIQPPAWAGEKPVLIAEAEDIVPRRTFRVWYDQAEAERSGDGRLRRDRRLLFRIEQVDSGQQVDAFGSWEDVEAWHGRTVISAGWRVLNPVPELGQQPKEAPQEAPEGLQAEPQE